MGCEVTNCCIETDTPEAVSGRIMGILGWDFRVMEQNLGVILEWNDKVDGRVWGRNIRWKGQNIGNRKEVENGKNVGNVRNTRKRKVRMGDGLWNLVHSRDIQTKFFINLLEND